MKHTDINKIIFDIKNILDRLIGEDIEVEIHMVADELIANVDIGQIEQVLLNLATNARDAMPRGGRLILETANVALDDAYAREHPEVATRLTREFLALYETTDRLMRENRLFPIEPGAARPPRAP